MSRPGTERAAPAIACLNFSFFYGSQPILERINFCLAGGAWLTILGPNGSGKSTLLKSMLRLAEGGKSSGEMRVLGRPVNACSQLELARMLAYVPQAGGRIPPFTVRDFVSLSRYPYCCRASAEQARASGSVSAALELTNTARLAERRMDAISGGQRQRVYLAAALAQDTEILLLDEPASFLDPRHAHELNELLKRLHAEKGLTIITVTHDLSQPLDAGGLALVLREGRQIFFGQACELAAGRHILEKAFEHEFSYLVHPRTQKTLVVA